MCTVLDHKDMRGGGREDARSQLQTNDSMGGRTMEQPVMGMQNTCAMNTARPMGMGATPAAPAPPSALQATSSTTMHRSRVDMVSARNAWPSPTQGFWKPFAPRPHDRSMPHVVLRPANGDALAASMFVVLSRQGPYHERGEHQPLDGFSRARQKRRARAVCGRIAVW